jgi:hypothetical protein
VELLTFIKVFDALGNERPKILIQLEDCILKGIISISEGTPREEAMHTIYSQISSLKMDLVQDKHAMSWFNLTSDALAVPSTPPASEFPSSPSAYNIPADLCFHLKERFQGQWCLLKTVKPSKRCSATGGLASPPETRVNSPMFANGSTSTFQKGKLSPIRYCNPKDLHTSTEFFEDDLECRKLDDLTDQHGGVESHSTPPPALSEDDKVGEDSTIVGGSREPSLQPCKDYSAMDEFASRQPSPPLLEDDVPMVDDETREVPVDMEEDDAGKAMESLSHPQEVDLTMVGIESRLPSLNLQEDDASMAGVESMKLSLDTREDDEVGRPMKEVGVVEATPMDGIESESEEVDEEGGSENAVEATPTNEEDSMVVVGSKERSFRVDGEGGSENVVEVEEATPTNGIEPRRSSRNISAKNKPMANYTAVHKSSRAKKKPPFEKEDILLLASLWNVSIRYR